MQQFKLVLILIGSLLSVNVFAQVKINVQKGQKYQVVNESKVSSVASVMGQEMENTAETSTTTAYEVKELEASEIKMESTLTRLKVNAQAMGQSTVYDSDKKDNSGPLAEELSKTVGKTKTIKLDQKGTITKQDAPESGDSPANMMMGIGSNSSELELFIPAFIGTELKVGSTYPKNSEVKAEKLTTKLSGTYTVVSIDNGIAGITFAGTTDIDGTMEQMGQEMTTKTTGKVIGDIKFDIKTGMVLSSSTTTDADMTIEVGGMSIPVKVKTTTTSTTTQMN